MDILVPAKSIFYPGLPYHHDKWPWFPLFDITDLMISGMAAPGGARRHATNEPFTRLSGTIL
ncbi:MAG: hypothetical protein COA41_18955 [Sphingopyxis sp.]|nr:MAG: hypothetical protein COA41_18955 [Sphingopyxis sp.]